MAEFAIGALGTLIPKLAKLLKKEYDLKKSVKGGIRFLKAELESMQAALEKVSGVPADQLDENTRLWARDVRELSYDIEDSIDSYLVLVESKKAGKQHNIKVWVDRTVNSLYNIRRRHNMAAKVKDFESLVKEAKERYDRNKVDCVVASRTTEYVDPRLEAMYKRMTDLVGIDEPMSKLRDMLKLESTKSLKSVSVVGAGGLGKTTLVKAVYDDTLEVGFQCRAFVSVGQNPDVKKVLNDILLELDKEKFRDIHSLTRDVKQLIDLLREFLGNKRYFVVIDDIWDTQSWQIIKMALVDNNRGSRLITTTRNFEVGKEAGVVYNLEPLSSFHSRQLLCTRILDSGINCLDNLPYDQLTDKILKKCGGIPLAIITMASLLADKPREEWFEVYSSISLSRQGNNQVETTMKILSLSYYDMPSHLRTCLLYLSIFPEDYVIKKESLIWMWIAEGFVHGQQGVGIFEVGERYFNALINRSMIQQWGYIDDASTGCRLHDMVLELIRSLSCEVNFVTILDNEQGTSAHRNIRRLSHQNMRIEYMTTEDAVDMKKIRSFIAISCTISEIIPFSCFHVLRVLALEDSEAQNNHIKHLGALLQLRYLMLSGMKLSELPEGIGDLKFLQTLDLGKTRVRKLPSTISNLTQLLCLRGRCSMDAGGAVIGKLTSLQELRMRVDLGNLESGYMLFCEGLGNLRELRVLKVEFKGLDSEQEVLGDSLRNMCKLQYLEVHEHHSWRSIKVEQVSRWNAPGAVLSRHIRVLLLADYRFSILPTCIDSSLLPNLSDLSMSVDFVSCQDMRIMKFPELCRLTVDTSLRTKLLVVYGGDGYFRRLKSFKLNWSFLVMFRGRKLGAPVMPILENLKFTLCDSLLEELCALYCQNISWLLSMIGWNYLPLLKLVDYSTSNSGPGGRELPVLSHAARSHPNRPTARTGGHVQREEVSHEVLYLPVHVWMFRETSVRFDFTKLASLEKVTAHIYCLYATPREVLRVEAALRRAVDVHPNNVFLEMTRFGEEEMDVPFTGEEEESHDATTQNKDICHHTNQSPTERISDRQTHS
ncbi:hypothetical protein PVAP13_8NG251000 [Panicum virgatum]|uniref:Uncharacterized protein n=1 Tax=Panicum virgatum TaxID=38727 RepID=A0A8T0P6J9_PANVG|nr:hypothetical protein PVAP13_8NG251000 [Panicum virgatum]